MFETEFTKILSMTQVLVGKKVMTPEKEQGFISEVYAGNKYDIDILEDDAASLDDTTSLEFQIGDYVFLFEDQTPQIDDLTPYGKVKGVERLTEGIYQVIFYEGDFTLWLSFERAVQQRPDDYSLDYAGWVIPKDVDAFLEYFDLWITAHGHIVRKRLHRHDTPEACELEVEMSNHKLQYWTARVDCNGMIDYVETCDGKVLTTLEELRATGVIQARLVSKYSIKNF